MNEFDAESDPARAADAFVPLVLLSLALIAIFVWQLVNISNQRIALLAAEEQLETNFKNSTPEQEKLLEQSKAVQAKLETFAIDLLNLAKAGDADAKKIIEKYKIQQQAPPAASSVP